MTSTLSQELLRRMPEELVNDGIGTGHYINGYNQCLAQVKEILGAVEVDEWKLKMLVQSITAEVLLNNTKNKLVHDGYITRKITATRHLDNELSQAIFSTNILKEGK